MSEGKRSHEEHEDHGEQSFSLTTGTAEYPRTFVLSAPCHRFTKALNELLLVFPDLLQRIEPEGAELFTGEHNVVHKVASYVATSSDYLIMCNGAAGPFTISLPTATLAGKVLIVAKTDASENAIQISCAPSNDLINGEASISLVSQYSRALLIADGISAWLRVV